MFYGLSKLIKRILPKQLFYRGLLIVATPIIILQVTISLVFFDSLWIKTNKGMTKALVSEVRTFIDAYDNDQNNKDYIIVMFKDYLQFNIKYEENFVNTYFVCGPDRLFSHNERMAGRIKGSWL